MSASNFSINEPKYYDPAEVDTYVNDATNTIKTLQSRLAEATRRAEEAERAAAEGKPETASLGRALLLASEVADKTISDADVKAAEIVHAAHERASSIIATAEADGRRVIESAQRAAVDVFRDGEARLLAAVDAFIEGSTVLRGELAKVHDEASSWRGSMHQPGGSPLQPEPRSHVPSPQRPDSPGGIHDRAPENGARPPVADPEAPARMNPLVSPRSSFIFPGDQSAGERS
jgi:hypothetical protein